MNSWVDFGYGTSGFSFPVLENSSMMWMPGRNRIFIGIIIRILIRDWWDTFRPRGGVLALFVGGRESAYGCILSLFLRRFNGGELVH